MPWGAAVATNGTTHRCLCEMLCVSAEALLLPCRWLGCFNEVFSPKRWDAIASFPIFPWEGGARPPRATVRVGELGGCGDPRGVW